MTLLTPGRRRPLVSALLAAAVLVPCVVVLAGHSQTDLAVYRDGGHAVRTAHDLYGFRVLRYGFTYPPFAGLVLTPLSLLSPVVARCSMLLVSVASLAAFARLAVPDLIARAYRSPSLTSVGGLIAVVVCEPVVSTVLNGQVNLVLGALVLYDALVLRRGMLIGVAAAIKLTPAIFVLYLLVCGRCREARTAALTFAAVTGLTWLILPGDSVRFWTRTVLSGTGIGDLTRPANQSLRGLAERALGVHVGAAVWVVLVVPTAMIGLVVARRVVRTGRERLALGLVGVTGCLVSPVAWTHHWIWCVPLIGGLWEVASRRGWPARLSVVACGALFATEWFGPADPHAHLGGWGQVLDDSFVLTAVGVLVVGMLGFLHSSGSSAKLELALG